MGGLASLFGVAVSLAIGGVVAAFVGLGALVWIRRRGLDLGPEGPVTATERGGAVERPAMTAPITDVIRPH